MKVILHFFVFCFLESFSWFELTLKRRLDIGQEGMLGGGGGVCVQYMFCFGIKVIGC